MGPSGPRAITAELLAKAAHLAAPLGSRVEAIVIGPGEAHAAALAAAGADRVLVADAPGFDPYTTEAHASVLADAIRRRAPRLVLLGSTVRGRDLAPRVAARLGLGLTGDAIDLDVDAEGRVRQLKPAFGGTIVAPILSRTRPEMATVRPGVLHAGAARPVARRDRRAPGRDGGDEPGAGRRPPGARRRRGRRRWRRPPWSSVWARASAARRRCPAIEQLAARLGAAVAATREVTDAGWLPRQHQVGLTGRAIAPRLYVALAVSGAMEHLVGLRRAGTIVAINKSPKAPILRAADIGIVADVNDMLPHLEAALRP